MVKTYSINQENDTIKLAERLAPWLKKGDVLALYGDLGSGKTFFTRYLCKSLGVVDLVTSPSFVLINQYESPIFDIYHVDLYRLHDEGDVWGLGLDELIEQGLMIIEWPLLAETLFGERTIKINFQFIKGERTLTLEGDISF